VVTDDITVEEQLQLISKAWGKQRGYCFFPWIRGDAKDKRERIRGYHEGPAFAWPKERGRILDHLREHQNDDVYWCPSLFEYRRRQAEVAMDEHALWADLDEIDPRGIEEQFKPTIAWETSPGRYQALWVVSQGDLQNASWPGYENQRLTYYLGADNSGWDTTQLLRIPGWHNHKPDRRSQNGNKPWKGRILWKVGPRYLPDHFTDLPEVANVQATANIILETELDRLDRHELWAKYKLKLRPHTRELITARDATGDRSEVLWQIERDLADIGLSVSEIITLVRSTVWNKYQGRADELKRLSIEAAKAIDERDFTPEEDAEKRPETLQRLTAYIADIKPPKWLIRNLWAQGSCGFIAGQPKSYKSWLALDAALSISTGDPFLGHFTIDRPGPVLYVQEEDSGPVLKRRYTTIMESSKTAYDAEITPNGEVFIEPREPRNNDPDVDVLIREGFIISDPAWQEWLDEQLSRKQYVAVILDPLLMMLGEVEENKAASMTNKIFRPLKQLSEKSGAAIIVVHHMRKGEANGQRGGQMMLGSVANHAWTEDSMYVTHAAGDLKVEVESKHAQGGSFKITHVRNRRWMPNVTDEHLGEDDQENLEVETRQSQSKTRVPRVVATMIAHPNLQTPSELAPVMKITTAGVVKQLNRAIASNLVEKTSPGHYQLTRMN